MTVDERVDEWALSAGRGGVFCKNLLHVYGCLPRVARALSMSDNRSNSTHANMW